MLWVFEQFRYDLALPRSKNISKQRHIYRTNLTSDVVKRQTLPHAHSLSNGVISGPFPDLRKLREKRRIQKRYFKNPKKIFQEFVCFDK
jgi:hypothetical protein